MVMRSALQRGAEPALMQESPMSIAGKALQHRRQTLTNVPKSGRMSSINTCLKLGSGPVRFNSGLKKSVVYVLLYHLL